MAEPDTVTAPEAVLSWVLAEQWDPQIVHELETEERRMTNDCWRAHYIPRCFSGYIYSSLRYSSSRFLFLRFFKNYSLSSGFSSYSESYHYMFLTCLITSLSIALTLFFSFPLVRITSLQWFLQQPLPLTFTPSFTPSPPNLHIFSRHKRLSPVSCKINPQITMRE